MSALLIAIYVANTVFCCGALLAALQKPTRAPFSNDAFNAEHYRNDLSMSILFSLWGPVSLVLAVFTTGFLEHGWRLTRRVEVQQ
jgi:hypothetical protein